MGRAVCAKPKNFHVADVSSFENVRKFVLGPCHIGLSDGGVYRPNFKVAMPVPTKVTSAWTYPLTSGSSSQSG